MSIDIRKLQDDCLAIQDACNLSGVLLAWGRHQMLIRDHARAMGIKYETHPANILFLSKVTSLMQVDADCIGGVSRTSVARPGVTADLFHNAYKWAKGEIG